MKSDKDHIKNIFSSKLSSFEPDLPDLIWEKIDADLSLLPINKKKATRQTLYKTCTWIAGVAAAVLALYWVFPIQDEEKSGREFFMAQHVDRNKYENKRVAVLDTEQKLQSENRSEKASSSQTNYASPTIQSLGLSENIQEAKLLSDKLEGVIVAKDDQISDNNSEVLAETPEIKDSDFEKKLNEQIAVFEAEGKKLDDMFAVNTVDNVKSRKSNGFQLGVEGGSGFSKSNEDKNKLNSMLPNSPGTVMLRTNKVKMEHHQPITFGIAVNKRINDKISIESGITYTYLSSRIKSDENAEIQQKEMQYLHYLGIPLTVNYTFAEWRKFRFYTSLGGMLQKDFYGRIKSRMSIDGLLETETENEKKISQKNPQFSATATLGASYPIYDKLRVYSNFGGAYYFDAKNEHETIYSDKKWLFNLNLGLKFEF